MSNTGCPTCGCRVYDETGPCKAEKLINRIHAEVEDYFALDASAEFALMNIRSLVEEAVQEAAS